MNQPSSYSKPWLSIEDQLHLLKTKGMIISNPDKASSCLAKVGYYRLSAYWHPFRKADPQIKNKLLDEFHPNTYFEDAFNLYLFDKNLRQLMLDALERIEIALKVDIAHTLGEIDQFAHTTSDFFNKRALSQTNTAQLQGSSKAGNWHQNYYKLVSRSKEDFVKHFKSKYSGNLPIWVAVEIWDFGSLSTFYSILLRRFQTKISVRYGLSDPEVLVSWLRALNYLRNIVAHHSRLWNRNIVEKPRLPKMELNGWWQYCSIDEHLRSKPFILFAIVRHMLLQISPNTQWHKRLESYLIKFPVQESDMKRSIEDIGAPSCWQNWW